MLVLTSGCSGKLRSELHDAKSLIIGYTTLGQAKFLTIDDRRQVSELLAALEIEATEEGVQAGVEAIGTVRFIMPDGIAIETTFVTRRRLDRSWWGRIDLRNERFYDKVCEVVSAHERRAIDILRENP